MPRFAFTYILVALFALLAGAVWYFDLSSPKPTVTPTTMTAVLDVPIADVIYLQVTEAGKTAAVQKRDDGVWTIAQPSADDADNRRVEDIVSRIAKLNATRKIEGVTDLTSYGLAEPPIKMELRLKDGTSHQILVGAKTPDNSSYYVMPPGGSTIFVASSFTIGDVTRWITEPPRPRPTPTPFPTLPPVDTATPKP